MASSDGESVDSRVGRMMRKAFKPFTKQLQDRGGLVGQAEKPSFPKLRGGKHCLDDQAIQEASAVQPRDPSVLKKRKHYRPTLFVDGQDLELHEFFDSALFKTHLSELTDPQLTAKGINYDDLNTPPKKWQEIGQQKMWLMAHSLFRGGFLGDAVGLGKSFTTLLFVVRFKEEYPDSGPILIVTRKSCVLQWEQEIITHFKNGRRPRWIILDKANHPSKDIMSYDIIICTGHYVRRAFKVHASFEVTWATLLFRNNPKIKKHRRAQMPLHSGLYDACDRRIPVMIVDESQDARNPNSLLAAALRSIQPSIAFGLTGTIVHNKWDDIASQLSLLPGCPFQDTDHFRSIFGTDRPKGPRGGGKDMPGPPDEDKMRCLKTFMAGVLVARPKIVLGLPPIETHLIDFDLPDVGVQEHIYNYTRMALALFSKSKKHKKGSRRLALQGFQCIRAAQAHAASPLLVREKTVAHGEEDRSDSEEEDVPGLDDPELDDVVTKVLRTAVEHNEELPERNKKSEEQHTVSEEQHQRSEERKKKYEDFDDFDYAMNDVDIDYNPEAGSDDEFRDLYQYDKEPESEGSGTDGYTSSEDDQDPQSDQDDPDGAPRPSKKVERQIWLAKLRTETDARIYSPRVETVVKTCEEILSQYPDEKVLVTAEKIKLLDIIKEGIVRRAFVVASEIVEFNGTILRREERAKILSEFNQRGCGPRILLISSDAGGTGLNITGASHLILTEPFWCVGKRKQMIGRVYRMPQPRVVHIYDCVSIFSEIDRLLIARSSEKAAVGDDLMSVLVRSDDVPFNVGL